MATSSLAMFLDLCVDRPQENSTMRFGYQCAYTFHDHTSHRTTLHLRTRTVAAENIAKF